MELCQTHPEEATKMDANGSTPLHVFLWMNPLMESDSVGRILTQLVACHPAAVTSKDTNGDTPLHIALFVNRDLTSNGFQMLQPLWQAFPNVATLVNREGQMLLHLACRYSPSNVDLLTSLVELNPSAVEKHVRIGERSKRTKHYKRYVDTEVPSPMEPPLRQNSNSSQEDRPQHVIVDGMVHYSDTGYQMRFSDRNATQHRDGAYPVHLLVASPKSTLETLHLVLPKSLHVVDKYGRTPLHVALGNPQVTLQIVTFLVEHDANLLAAQDRAQDLPLHTACRTGVSIEVLQFLAETYPPGISQTNQEGLHPVEVLAASHAQGYEDACRWMAVHKWNLHSQGHSVC
jgi:ankyrin repeat protein